MPLLTAQSMILSLAFKPCPKLVKTGFVYGFFFDSLVLGNGVRLPGIKEAYSNVPNDVCASLLVTGQRVAFALLYPV